MNSLTRSCTAAQVESTTTGTSSVVSITSSSATPSSPTW